jgi:hypothetical protein
MSDIDGIKMFLFPELWSNLIVKNLIGKKNLLMDYLLFVHKVKDELINSTIGLIEYDNLTYSDLFSTIKKLGIKMCIDQKMIRQQLKKMLEKKNMK